MLNSLKEPLNVTHVVLSLDSGGLEQVVLSLAGAGRRVGQQVSVICLERPGTLAPQAEALGAEVVSLDKGPGWSAKALLMLRQIFYRLRPDVLHTHQIGALFQAGPVARAFGIVPILHTEHGRQYEDSSRRRWVGRLAALHARRFICVSRDVARRVVVQRVVPSWKVNVISNGIDLTAADGLGLEAGKEVRRSLGIPEKAPVIGTVGRLDEVKRQDRLLQGFARLLRRRPDAHLLIVGEGPWKPRLLALVNNLGLNGCAHLVGYQQKPLRFLQAMDLFALTSRSEGMPLAVLEAWAAKVPVVASRIEGLVELIEHGRTGILFDPDDHDEFDSTTYDLLEDQGLRHSLARAGRSKVEADHDVLRMAGRYASLYTELRNHAYPNAYEFVPESVATASGPVQSSRGSGVGEPSSNLGDRANRLDG